MHLTQLSLTECTHVSESAPHNHIFRSLFSGPGAHQEIEMCAKGQLALPTKRSNDKRQTVQCTCTEIQIQIQKLTQTVRTKRFNNKN